MPSPRESSGEAIVRQSPRERHPRPSGPGRDGSGPARPVHARPRLRDLATEDRAVDIGLEQTISQPFIVAVMTAGTRPDRHRARPGDRHRQRLPGRGPRPTWRRRSITVERFAELSLRARGVLDGLGLTQHPLPDRRRHAGLARGSPLRPDHRHRRRPGVAPVAVRTTLRRRPDRRADRRRRVATDHGRAEGEGKGRLARSPILPVRQVDRRGRVERGSLTVPILPQLSIRRSRLTISIAARAASTPLLPALRPERLRACSTVSVVRTPKITGTPVASPA